MTKEKLEQMIEFYLDAELKVLKGQSVAMDGKTLTRANLDSIVRTREALELRLAKMNSRKAIRVTF